MITMDGVSKSFDGGRTYAVRDLVLEVIDGETLVMLGTSGSGKSTTLKMINRLIEPSTGAIEVDGRDVKEQDPTELRRSMGYVFQGIGLFPHMTAEENVTVVLRLLGWSSEAKAERARELMNFIGLPPDKYATRLPEELSGGEQQRVGVARALAADPKYLLMDEPFGALDALTRDILQKELLSLKEQLHKTVIFVTHDILEALTLADRIAVLHRGRLQQMGKKEEILSSPATAFVRDLFGKPAKQLAKFKDLES